MPQVTLYLDDETDALARASAAAAGLSYSRWLGELIRSSSDWPPEIPLREELGESKGVDVPRVALDE